MKNSTRNKINLIFSSFLVIGYIVSTYFFSTMANRVTGTIGSILQVLILVVFGLLLFFATRVGEGKQVKRFSLAVLLMVVLPSIYIIAASLIKGLPLHDFLAATSVVVNTGETVNSQPVVMMLAAIALGYGIPYTFLAGYELKTEEDEAKAEEPAAVEGGLAEELAEAENETDNDAEKEAEPEAEAEDGEEKDPETAEAEAEEKAQAEKDAEAETEAEIALQETKV